MKAQVKNVLSLFLICFIAAGLLAVVNMITAPVIEKKLAAQAQQALVEVLPEGEGFTEVDLSQYNLPDSIDAIYSTTNNAGYVVQLTKTGYDKGLVIMCGISPEGVVVGTKCIASKETLKQEQTYGASLIGATADTIGNIDTVAGATMTTGAYREAIKEAINAVILLTGGEADFRTEEEILRDNLSAALPAGGTEFSYHFVPETLSGVDVVYAANNGAGYVFVIGETFVGVDATGAIVGEVDSVPRQVVEVAAPVLLASHMTEVDITALKEAGTISNMVNKVFITDSGNYVLEMTAHGYGITAPYKPNGVPIIYRVAISPDGVIIAGETISHQETEKYAGACDGVDFYLTWVGKTEANYTDIVVSGASFTTTGYQESLLVALNTIEILKGAL